MDTRLLDLIRDLDRILDAPSTDARWRPELTARMHDLRDEWERRRAMWDSDDGLYHDLTEAEPRVTPQIRRLRDDSMRLQATCDQAIATLQQPGSSDEESRRAVRDVIDHVERHLSLTTTATYDALAVDLGSDA